MTEEQEHFLKLANRYRRIALVSVFFYALLHSFGAVVFWIAGGIAGGAFLLSIYYRRLANPPATAQPTWQRPGPAPARSPGSPNPEGFRRLLKFAPLIFIASVFVFLFWIIISSNSSSESSGDSGASTDEVTTLRTAVDKNPNDGDALLNLGNAFFNERQYDSARFYYNRCLSVSPTYKEALYNIALSWSNERDFGQAINTLQKCLEQNPDYGDALQLMGSCYYQQDQKDQALSFFQRAYDQGIRNAELSHYLAYLYDLQNNTSRALEFYKEAIRQDSSKVEVYKRLAELVPEQSEFYLRKAKEWQGK